MTSLEWREEGGSWIASSRTDKFIILRLGLTRYACYLNDEADPFAYRRTLRGAKKRCADVAAERGWVAVFRASVGIEE